MKRKQNSSPLKTTKEQNREYVSEEELIAFNKAIIENYRVAYKELVEEKQKTVAVKKFNYDLGENTDTEDSDDNELNWNVGANINFINQNKSCAPKSMN